VLCPGLALERVLAVVVIWMPWLWRTGSPVIARLLGILLRGRHAGDARLLHHELPAEPGEVSLQLSSSAFIAGGTIPDRYAGEGVGDNVSPPLRWSVPPSGTVELVLVMEDPDAPLRRPFVHLIAAGIDPFVTGFSEGILGADSSAACVLGITTFRHRGYSGPRALPGHGPHRYVFQLFALGERSGLARGARRGELVAALKGKLLARGTLEGYSERR
jgi:Raf kinase inhibitor-like YbhB/YbcL family protein